MRTDDSKIDVAEIALNSIKRPDSKDISARIAVVIPTYNHAEFLGHALTSVREQSFTDWMAIVVNNFSSDATQSIVASFQDPRIRLVNFANHGVIAASRNFGIRSTTSELIAFLDSDDCWYPEKLEQCVRKLEAGYDLVCHGEAWVSEKNGTRRVREVIYGPEARASLSSLLFDGNCISTSAVVVRRAALESVEGFDESGDIITAEDYHLWLKLVRSGCRVGFIPKMLGEYRIHPGNTSKAGLRNMHAVRSVFEKIYAKYPNPPVMHRILACRGRAIIDYSGARVLQDNGEHRQAFPLFLRAIIRWPFIPKFYAAFLFNAIGRRLSH
jgi:glycosyltransferase involved in cell wall biosynthesis